MLCAAAGAPDGPSWSTSATTTTPTGRAHPMIDPSLRLERLAEVAADPTTGVMLLDVVLGHGAEDDPAASLAPAIAGIRPAGGDHGRRHRARPAGPATARSTRWSRPGPRSTCPTPARPVARSRSWEAPMTARDEHIADRVVSVGVDLLAEAVEDQAAPVTRVDWRPPLPGTEDDLATVALDPLRPDANAPALERMLAVQARARRRAARPRGARAGAGRVPARGPTDHLGARVRAAPGRADGRRRARGPGRHARGGAPRCFEGGLHVRARAVPPPPRRRADGRRGHAEHVDVRARGPRHRRPHPLHAQRGARQGSALRRLLPRGARPACAG